MTSREIIRRVLAFDHPSRIGMTFSEYEGQPRLNDCRGVGGDPDPEDTRTWEDDGRGGEVLRDGWGNLWRRIKGGASRGEVVEPAIKEWTDLANYQPPRVADPSRYQEAARLREQQPDKYLFGGLVGCAFNSARYLRGMEAYLCDCAGEPDKIRALNRMVNDIALAQVDIYADLGADGVFFAEDWGTQERLLVSPKMWREVFREDFARLISHAHSRGLTVWMHSCGCITDIVGDLVELGMDVLQFDQPELHGLESLARYAGRVTYYCPVDIQRILPTGDKTLIQAEARRMVEMLGGQGGGFIAKDYSDNHSIGCDPLWQQWGYETFLQVGKYPTSSRE